MIGDTGFKSVRFSLQPDATSAHEIFFKEHTAKRSDPRFPRGRTLFVINVPPYATVQHLAGIFGRVKSAKFADGAEGGFKTAYLVFERESGLERALATPESSVFGVALSESTTTGLARWCKGYNQTVMVSEEELKRDIENHMRNYDKRVEERLKREKEEEESKEGWQKVTGRKKRGRVATARKESVLGAVRLKEEMKSGKKQLLNFYSFQIRESKKEHLAQLRKKFELDKKRLQELKSKRTFKPF